MESRSEPSLARLAWVFLKAGNLTFGGGDPTMAVLQREFTQRTGWLTMEQHTLAFSLARVTPGTNILAYCAASASMLGGWLASLVAVTAACLPASILAVWLTITFESSARNPVAQAVVAATIAAVVGMMLASAFALMKPYLTARRWPRVLLIAGSTVLLREGLHMGPVQLLLIAAVAGYFWPEP